MAKFQPKLELPIYLLIYSFWIILGIPAPLGSPFSRYRYMHHPNWFVHCSAFTSQMSGAIAIQYHFNITVTAKTAEKTSRAAQMSLNLTREKKKTPLALGCCPKTSTWRTPWKRRGDLGRPTCCSSRVLEWSGHMEWCGMMVDHSSLLSGGFTHFDLAIVAGKVIMGDQKTESVALLPQLKFP